MKLSDNHISLSTAQAVNEICAPLFSDTDINYFHYAKVYDNGGVAVLVSNPHFHKHFWENKYDKDFFKLYKPGIFFNEPGANQVLADARSFFNIDHLMMILQRKNNYYEVFAFATKRNNDAITSFYLNNLELLNKFGCYFKYKSESLIHAADNELIFSDEYKPIIPYKHDTSNELSQMFTFGHDNHKKLSRKQHECLYYLSRGMSHKQIANHLGISPRTVEDYISIIKEKLNCHTRSQLIEITNRLNLNYIKNQ